MDYRVLLGFVSAFVSLVSLFPYARSMIRGKTRPHLFTWLVWAILTTLIFLIQLNGNAGPGAWGSGVIATTSLFIFVFSCFKGEKTGSYLDWFSLVTALLAIPLWLVTPDPTASAIFVTVIDVIAFWPTVSKSWRDPHSENFAYYVCWLIKYPSACFALATFSVANAVYPVTWSFIGIFFTLMLFVRGKKVAPLLVH